MSFCVKEANILLPKENIDYKKYAVIACDQYTSEKEYWDKLKNYCNGSISTLNLILPEAYLQKDNTEIINTVNKNMLQYLNQNIFTEHKNCFIYTKRQTPYSKTRRGLIANIDLEYYSYSDNNSMIRASEGTVLSRIPPRVKIRENASLELPHIMLLIDDRENSVIKEIEKEISEKNCVYDTDLNMNGGHIKGYKIENTEKIIYRLKELTDKNLLKQKYGKDENLLIAVGDGNHSLATAKTIWESIKPTLTKEERENHPARYALSEIVNIHDEGIIFHPIHRVFFVKQKDEFIKGLKNICAKYNDKSGKIIFEEKTQVLKLPTNAAEAVEIVQNYADKFTDKNGGYTDYVHGEDSVKNICKRENAIGVLLPSLKKEDFFNYIVKKGSLPRKTFSMGEACEKRYYIEARKIVK